MGDVVVSTPLQDYIKNKIMTHNVFPNSHVSLDLLSKCSRLQSNERRERYAGAASAKGPLCCGGVQNMHERVGKKQVRLHVLFAHWRETYSFPLAVSTYP